MRQKKRKKAATQTLMMTAIVIMVIAALCVLAFSRVFVVRDIMVVGNRHLLEEEVITQSGVKIGDNMLSITSGLLRSKLDQNRYIQYVGHGFDYRGTLTIQIDERLGMAVSNVLGLYYVMDEDGMVLECAGSSYPTNVAGPRVTGFAMDQHSRVVIGERMPVSDQAQLNVMEHVLRALEETDMLARTSLLDVKLVDNIYIMTMDGAKVELGDSKNLKTKLLIAQHVLTLKEEAGDLKGAKIDVSNGENAHFIPSVLPTVTPVPTATPTLAPPSTPKP